MRRADDLPLSKDGYSYAIIDPMTFNSSTLREEARRLGVILVAAGLIGGLLEDAGLVVVSSLVLAGIMTLLIGCLDEENNK